MDADGADHARIRGEGRGPDRMDQGLDRQGRVHQAERPGEQALLRAALHRRKLWTPRIAAWNAHRGACLCSGTGSRSKNHRQHKGWFSASRRSLAVTRASSIACRMRPRAEPSAAGSAKLAGASNLVMLACSGLSQFFRYWLMVSQRMM